MVAGILGHISFLSPKRLLFYVAHLLPAKLTASSPAWQFQLPPSSSQTSEIFWYKEHVHGIREALWGHNVAKWQVWLWSQAARTSTPDPPITGCLS